MTVSVTMLSTRMGEAGEYLEAGQTYDVTEGFARYLVQYQWATATFGNRTGYTAPTAYVTAENQYQLLDHEGGVISLSEISPVVTITATGSVSTSAGYYRGIKVTAYSGGPQTITIYDALSATGTPVDTIVVSGTGTWLWDRPSDVLGGVGGRRPMATGCWAVISGGTSRTIDVMFE